MESASHFDVTEAAIYLLEKQFQDKEVVLVYENLTHDGGDELPSDVYHLYIFTVENGHLHYYTTSYEKRHVPSDKPIYPPVNGIQLDEQLPIVYIEGIHNRVSMYFEFMRDHPQVKFVLDWLEKIIANAFIS
jgi:hypothetical protein